VEKPVFKGGKIPSNLIVFGGRGGENAGHVGYSAHAGREKQPETARSGPGRDSAQALQPAHRADLLRLNRAGAGSNTLPGPGRRHPEMLTPDRM
jgi:hypothetical protein